jgi:ketosteroid isomerase-like protein
MGAHCPDLNHNEPISGRQAGQSLRRVELPDQMGNVAFGNKAVLQHAFEQTAEENGRSFLDVLADAVRWEIIGTTDWPRFIARGAIAGVNTRTTNNGSAYPNRYCWIFRMRDGKAVEVTEYCDTQRIDHVLSYPH